jgi:uncharacterized protein (TIGR02145 family)
MNKHYSNIFIINLLFMTCICLFMFSTCSKNKNNPFNSSIDSIAKTFLDIDRNIYHVVKIGDQFWMSENLSVTRYSNGDSIPNVINNINWSKLTTGGYCIYYNDTSNIKIHSVLYNWAAINDPRCLAPQGWHVPSDNEWKQLEIYLGMSPTEADRNKDWRGTDEGGKLKETGTVHWYSPNTGATNECNFSALAGGYRGYDGSFLEMGNIATFWSSTKSSVHEANIRGINFDRSSLLRFDGDIRCGFSVRCVMDN